MRWRAAASAVLLGATLLVVETAVVAPVPASAARTDPVAVVVDGTGYGGGQGMSEWGAYGWAVDEGRSWQWIVRHYYPGSTIGTTPVSARTRVRLLAHDGRRTVGVISRGPGVRWKRITRASMYAREVAPGRFEVYGSTAVACPGSGKWTKLGTVAGPVVFRSANGEQSSTGAGAVLGVCDGGGAVTHYRGRIEVRDEALGIRVVNDVKVEDYLRGVVPTEVDARRATHGGGRGANALRAQAVSARSFVASQRNYPYAHLCDSSWCRAYGGSARRSSATGAATSVETAGSNAAVAATAGRVMRRPDGRPVAALVSESNGPRTAGGAFAAVDDAAGDDTAANPNHRWTRVLDADALAAKYGLGTLSWAGMVEAADPQNRRFDGIWYNDLLLRGTAGSVRIPATELRGAYALPSPGFDVRMISEETTATRLGLIGDSVGHSIAGVAGDELIALTDGKYRGRSFHVLGSRCTTNPSCPGKSGVEAVADLPRDLDLVVVEMGYNDWPPGFAADIDAMMRALVARGAKRVAWVNLAELRRTATGVSYYAQSNAALRAAPARWPTLTILDWKGASANPERPRWFSDTVHLTSTGQAEFALFLRRQLDRLTPSHQLGPPKRIELKVVGRALVGPDGVRRTVPPAARAVALSVTSVDADASGFATVWNCGAGRPTSSNLNYPGRTSVANSVIAPIGAGGRICLYSHRPSDVVVDVSGWFTPNGYVAVTPRRLVDTRSGTGARVGRVRPGAPLRVQVAGARATYPNGGSAVVPAGVEAVALNLTATDARAKGYLTAWPCDSRRPGTSNLNYGRGATIANGAMVPVAADGSICIHSYRATHVVVDLVGWVGASGATDSAPAFVGGHPRRLLDTRNGTGGRRQPVAPGSPASVVVRDVGLAVDEAIRRVPSTASAVVANVTVVSPAGRGFATVWPCGVARPTASNVNFRAGQNVASMVVAPVGRNGAICVHSSRRAHVVVDVAGWFTGGAAPGFAAATPTRLVDTREALGPAPR